MLEIYLMTNDDTFRIPVTPEEYTLNSNTQIEKTKLINKGEVCSFEGNSLRTISLNSFFTKRQASYVARNSPLPYDIVYIFNRWRTNGQVLRLVIPTTNVNMLVLIENFNTTEKDGTRDVYYNLNLVEYKEPTLTLLDEEHELRLNDNLILQSDEDKVMQRSYTVVKGDTLIDITKRELGHTDWKMLSVANEEKYPTLKQSTIIQIGWELIIP